MASSTTSTYVVTGASRGIGFEFVNQLAAKGNKVFACARNPDKSEQLQKLVADNKHVFAVKLDTTSEESIKAAVKEIEQNAPEGIDVLINNAGIGSSKSMNIETVSKAEFLKLFETNVCGVSDTTQAFLPLLRKRGQEQVKKIVNISSIMGSISEVHQVNPSGTVVAYHTSKAALNMLTKMTATYLAKENFIVYASHPGWVKTDLGGESAPVEVEDSVHGQIAKIESATSNDNGGFFDFNGTPLNW
ncbi:uncharacterized protein BX663DRAFT_512565 [Cokeromyces recurvatus]|uniref:uncharacterized protein n=1 Tax=Cokeromyces recurvatus TaxID=90255 RepID=UPI00221FCFFB|nr:uncharacterized protein BX663DRAFT_512565 [Cokeromyces recurvatus]KAI7901836.1 hypothetical protein BX663DRAFT_512565 [Cokeromyces recurvatus]